MRKAFISPSKYVQGEKELNNLGYYIAQLGKSALIVGKEEDIDRVRNQLTYTEDKFEVEFVNADFQGEVTREEIARLQKIFKENHCDCLVGLGGGKAIDTAKCVAEGKNVIIVPTIVAQDAPTSHLADIYHEDGSFDASAHFQDSPSVVLVDTAVIAKAPSRYLLAGMGDALATYFEARATRRSNSNVNAGQPNGIQDGIAQEAKGTNAAYALARLAYDMLLEHGQAAKLASDLNQVTPALEDIIETNVLLSGLGFESGGLAAVHAIYSGFSLLHEKSDALHGEIVSFGTICQLLMEDAPKAEVEQVLAFQEAVGLPMTLSDIGFDDMTDEELETVAEKAMNPKGSIQSMPFDVTVQAVKSAILTADKLGQTYKKG